MKFLPISQVLKMLTEGVVTQYIYIGDYDELRSLQKQISAYKQSTLKCKTKILPTIDGNSVRNFMVVEPMEPIDESSPNESSSLP